MAAEGVEIEQQLEFLRDNRCDELQGFYFGRPLAGRQFMREFLQSPRALVSAPAP